MDKSPTMKNISNGRVRYFVALMSFIICSLLNIHRLILGVAIVAMVKPKHLEQTDRGNFSATSCPINNEYQNAVDTGLKGELDWSSEVQGYVLSAGFISYMLTHIPGGRCAEKWGAMKTLFYSNVMASIFTTITPFAAWWNAYAVIVVQFLRGLAQGVVIPALFVLMSRWFPRQERGLLSTIVMSGFAIGAPIGGVTAGWLCDVAALGWASAFYIGGVFAALISLLFVFVVYETPQSHPTISPEELKYITEGQECDMTLASPPVPWKKIFTSLPVYALTFGLLGQYWSVTYFLSVHPTYMGTVLHFSMTKNGAASTIPVALKCVGGILSSFLSNWITKNNYIGISNLRKTFNFVGTIGFCSCLTGVYWAGCDKFLNTACFSLSLFCSGMALSGSMIAAGDMSPRFSGSLIGLTATVASFSTFIIPIMVGNLTQNQTLEEWHTVFFVSIAIVFSCGIIFNIFGSAEIQSWNDPELKDKHLKNRSDFAKEESQEQDFKD